MEALQAYAYTVIDDGTNPANQLATLLDYLWDEAPLAEGELPREVLLVVSKLKKYVKARSGMNTADSATDALSDIVRAACDHAVRNAARDERKTLLERDIPKRTRFED